MCVHGKRVQVDWYRENNYKKKKKKRKNVFICIHTFVLYAINEQKTCVNAIRVATHDTLHAVNLGIYCKEL